MCLLFSPKPLPKKIIKIRSSLTDVSKECKTRVKISKMNISLQLLLRSSHAGMFPKKIRLQKQPSRCIFQYRCSAIVVNSLKNTCDGVQIFQLWTTAAEKLYFVTALIDAERQLLQNTSRKLLLRLEVVVPRCSSE